MTSALRKRCAYACRRVFLAALVGVLPGSLAWSQEVAREPAGPAAAPSDEQREPFQSPMTPSERRWLLDRAEALRYKELKKPDAAKSEFVPSGDLPPEIREIQNDLGGPVVDQFPSLRSSEPPRRRVRPGSQPVDSRRAAIDALRDAAWHMDSWANRLEELDMFEHADALREHAQRLRLDARALRRPASDGGEPAKAPPLQFELGASPEADDR